MGPIEASLPLIGPPFSSSFYAIFINIYMKTRSYNREFFICTSQILDVFNDITIDRRTPDGIIQQTLKIPAVYGNRSRILKSAENRNATLKIPQIIISMKTISKDPSRAHSVNDGLQFQTVPVSGALDYTQFVATPINIGYELSIVTKFQEDMDEILCNFIPFMNPDVFVVWPSPRGNGNIKSQIVWNGEVNIIYPEELGETDPWRMYATTGLTFKTWVFPGMGVEDTSGPRITKFNIVDRANQYGSFFDVQAVSSIADYKTAIDAGLIQPPNFDTWPLTGYVDSDGEKHIGLSGGIN